MAAKGKPLAMPDDTLVALPDKATVLEELRDLLPHLHVLVHAAWRSMRFNPPSNLLVYGPAATAGCLVAHMAAEAQSLLGENPRVYFRSVEETWMVVDQRYDIRFKKLSRDGVPTNTETGRQRRVTL